MLDSLRAVECIDAVPTDRRDHNCGMDVSDRESAETVGVVARKLCLSIRTLHHWDQLGIASPSGRTLGGYREYLPADVARLRRVLLFRDLGVPLRKIPALLNATAADRRLEMRRRQEELKAKIRHLQSVEATVARMLKADEVGVLLSAAEQQDAFGASWDPAWGPSAREQWGDSAQWAEYAERSALRTADDWQRAVAPMQDVTDAFALAKRGGVIPGSDAANVLAEDHRAAMGEYFHCTLSMQVLMARRYVAEAGFTEYYDQFEPGLAEWMKLVIDAHARAKGIEPDTAAWE